jgi:hypothetical protein
MLLCGRSFGTPRRGRIEQGSSSHHRSDAHAAADRVAPRPDGTPAPHTHLAPGPRQIVQGLVVDRSVGTSSDDIFEDRDGHRRVGRSDLASASRTRRSASEGEICRIHEAWLHDESASRASSSKRRLTGSAPGAAPPRQGHRSTGIDPDPRPRECRFTACCEAGPWDRDGAGPG